MVSSGCEGVKVGSYYLMGRVSLGENEQVHEMDGGDGCIAV